MKTEFACIPCIMQQTIDTVELATDDVELRKVADLSEARQALKGLGEDVEITFLDNKGIW